MWVLILTKSVSKNGLRLLSLGQEFGLSMVNSFFEKSDHRRLTWHHHRTRKGAMLDFLSMKRSQSLQITDIRVSRKADPNSDHCLVILNTKMINMMRHYEKKGQWRSWGGENQGPG